MSSRKNNKTEFEENDSRPSAGERTYSPAEICQRFDLPRTTLFRWEKLDEIPPAVRTGKKGERVYKEEHFRRIAALARKKIATEIGAPSRYSADNAYPPLDLAEKLYLLEIVSDSCPLHAVDSLAALGKKHQLSEKTLDSLLDTVRARKIDDPVTRKILELLVEQAKKAAGLNQ
jgi:hypothetical protein